MACDQSLRMVTQFCLVSMLEKHLILLLSSSCSEECHLLEIRLNGHCDRSFVTGLSVRLYINKPTVKIVTPNHVLLSNDICIFPSLFYHRWV